MLIKSGIQFTELPAIQEDWAQCAVARVNSLQGDITVGAVYFPPGTRLQRLTCMSSSSPSDLASLQPETSMQSTPGGGPAQTTPKAKRSTST